MEGQRGETTTPKVLVIGAGKMGLRIIAELARRGCLVTVCDVLPGARTTAMHRLEEVIGRFKCYNVLINVNRK